MAKQKFFTEAFCLLAIVKRLTQEESSYIYLHPLWKRHYIPAHLSLECWIPESHVSFRRTMHHLCHCVALCVTCVNASCYASHVSWRHVKHHMCHPIALCVTCVIASHCASQANIASKKVLSFSLKRQMSSRSRWKSFFFSCQQNDIFIFFFLGVTSSFVAL